MAEHDPCMQVLDWLQARVGIKMGQYDSGKRTKPQRDVQPPAPFGFRFDNRTSAVFLKRCGSSHEIKRLDKSRTSHTVRYRDPETKLELRWDGIAFHDFPTVEWTLYFRNTGSENTPILSDIQALKTTFKTRNGAEAILHANLGDSCSPSSFRPITKELPPKASYTSSSQGGRPTNGGFPYFNLESGSRGLIAVIAWPGQWKATFRRDSGNLIYVEAGQEGTHFVLHPGEEVRTPRIVLQFWDGGDWIDAQNVWRRWMSAHNMPRPGGKQVPPMNLGSSHRVHTEMTKATEKKLIRFIGRFLEERLKIDCWWMDAGWYECDGKWSNTGSWWPDASRFPRGLKPVSDFAHRNGMKTMLWFEPERVQPGTWLASNHPEWLLAEPGAKEPVRRLLDLGNPTARQWLTNHVDRLMREQDIDFYRQDFNMDPIEIWRGNDREDRQGITEIKHVTGYLAHLTELVRRFPDMLIDTCASGGRRLSLDTLRYAVPLWRSDHQYVSKDMPGLTYGLALWIPYFGSGNLACESGYYGEGGLPVEPYAFWACCYPAINCAIDVRAKDVDYEALRELFRKVPHTNRCMILGNGRSPRQ